MGMDFDLLPDDGNRDKNANDNEGAQAPGMQNYILVTVGSSMGTVKQRDLVDKNMPKK